MAVPLRVPVGLLAFGYGVLVLVGVIAHDDAWAGVLAAAAGLLLLIPSLHRIPPLRAPRSAAVAALGLGIAATVVAYNVLAHSGLGPPEWGLILYGLALAACAPWLARPVARTTVATLVGWSFPVLLAPLALFAANALLSGSGGPAAATPFVQWAIVRPAASALWLTGTSAQVHGSTILVPTSRGLLSLGVGLVCAGVYPMVLFGGLVAAHAWTDHVPPRRLAALVGFGSLGLWAVNLVRLVVLTRIGIAWGPAALESAHANLGWILFAAAMVVFWAVALRRRAPAVG